MITNTQTQECQDMLLKRQNELIDLLHDHFDLNRAFTQESMGELSNYDNHPADHGSELFERGKDIALNEHAEQELEDINKALHAIVEGTYGICKHCGRDISFERLQAMPTADTCMEHAENRFERGDRPIEEDVLSPQINPNRQAQFDQTGYDAEDAWQDVSRYGTSETPSDFYGDRDNYNDMYPNSNSVEEIIDDRDDDDTF